MRVGIVQYAPVHARPLLNWEYVKEKIIHSRAELILLPELAFTGYLFLSRDNLYPLAESLPDGSIFRQIREFSRKSKRAIAYGFPLKEGNKIYNAAVFISPDGSYHVYRKVHLFGTEKKVFDKGNTFQVFSYRGIKLGFLICYDWAFPESARVLALKGAQILLHPANLVLHYAQEAMKTRALENHVFVVTANRIGEENVGGFSLTFRGDSQVVNPKGEILFRASQKEGFFEVEIDPQEALNKVLSPGNDLFKDRYPSAYEEICSTD